MNGTITLDMDDEGNVICNARRNKPYAHQRKIFDKDDFGNIHSFVSHYIEAINDPAVKWGAG